MQLVEKKELVVLIKLMQLIHELGWDEHYRSRLKFRRSTDLLEGLFNLEYHTSHPEFTGKVISSQFDNKVFGGIHRYSKAFVIYLANIRKIRRIAALEDVFNRLEKDNRSYATYIRQVRRQLLNFRDNVRPEHLCWQKQHQRHQSFHNHFHNKVSRMWEDLTRLFLFNYILSRKPLSLSSARHRCELHALVKYISRYALLGSEEKFISNMQKGYVLARYENLDQNAIHSSTCMSFLADNLHLAKVIKATIQFSNEKVANIVFDKANNVNNDTLQNQAIVHRLVTTRKLWELSHSMRLKGDKHDIVYERGQGNCLSVLPLTYNKVRLVFAISKDSFTDLDGADLAHY